MSNSGVDHVTRFPAADPSKAENFKAGFNSSGLAIDSRATSGSPTGSAAGLLGMAHLVDMGVRLKLKGVAAASDYLTKTMSEQQGRRRWWQRHVAAAGRHPLSGLSVHGRRSPGAMGCGRGWQ